MARALARLMTCGIQLRLSHVWMRVARQDGQLSSKVGESSKIPDMSGFPRPSLVSGRVLEESRNILIQTQEYTEKPRICLQLSYICHTFVYKNKAHSRASFAAVLKRFASRLKLF